MQVQIETHTGTTTTELNHKPPHTENKLTIMVFYGVSCLGKTTFTRNFVNYCKTRGIGIECISRDLIATSIIGEYKTNHPDVTDKEKIWFDNCEEITALFHKKILNLIKTCGEGKHALVIDDGRINPNLLKAISDETLLPSHEVEILAVYPKNSQKYEIAPERNLPFSSVLLLNLCHRGLNRESHGTMNYRDDKTLQIILSFTLLYEGTDDFVNTFKDEAKYSRMIEVPFLAQHEFEGRRNESILEEFDELLRKAYQSIKAPFEYLKESDPIALCNLARFLRDEEKIQEFSGYLSFAEKGEWLKIYNQVCCTAGGLEEDKENDVNRSN